MARESCRSVSVYCSGTRKKDTGGLFASAIGLVFRIDDSDDWPLHRVLVLLDNFTDTCGERVTLFQANFSIAGTRKARVRIRNNAEESCVVVAKRRIHCKYGLRVTRHGRHL